MEISVVYNFFNRTQLIMSASTFVFCPVFFVYSNFSGRELGSLT